MFLNYLAISEDIDPDIPISKYRVMPSKFTEFFTKSYNNENKYTIDDFTFRTDDGYDLVCFRMNLTKAHKKNITNKKHLDKPIQVVHGFAGSAIGLLSNKNSFIFNLQDKGYDVWCANARGNVFNYSHKNPEITSEKFFDFTGDDVGMKDIPAIYRNVLEITGRDKQILFSYSIGNMFMLMALSDSSTAGYINKHTERAVFMALLNFANFTEDPFVRENQVTREIIDEALELSKKMRVFHTDTGIFLSESKKDKERNRIVSEKYPIVDHTKSDLTKFDGVKDSVIKTILINELSFYLFPFLKFFGHYGYLFVEGSGTGVKFKCSIYNQNDQQFKNGKNQAMFKYDHGKEINKKLYGAEEAPTFDQSNVKIPIDILQGSKDLNGNYNEAKYFKDYMRNQNKNEDIKIHDVEGFHHVTFCFPRYKKDLDEIINKILD